MRYEGFHTEAALPIKQNQRVVIPAGVAVRSTNPSKRNYVTTRAMTVTVRMLMPGQSVPIRDAFGDKHVARALQARGFDYEPLIALREANSPEFYSGMIPMENPSVTWAGTGGYWCEVDINDVLEANNL